MTAPNPSTRWGRAIVDELAAGGLAHACVAPGSRSTPLVLAVAAHSAVAVTSHLDERSAAFFALGRAKRSESPTAVVSTSGTAAANFHPAVVEAHHSRVPLVVLTADRPAELHDAGANQTIDQDDLYGDAVRWSRTLPEPASGDRRLRSLRVAIARALAAARGPHPGPVHCNVPLSKPLEPPADADWAPAEDDMNLDAPAVTATRGRPTLDASAVATLASDVRAVDRGLIVTGPAVGDSLEGTALKALAGATGFPVFADPLSGHRFGDHVDEVLVSGGYDGYLHAVDVPEPDLVVRFGASPTSKRLRQYLRDAETRQVVVDPAGAWPEAEFTATDLLVADPTWLAETLADRLDETGEAAWRERIAAVESTYWETVEAVAGDRYFEGGIVASTLDATPNPATVYVSNSMPVRDLDRFARPRPREITALGNRGASGIDGVTSSALGAARAVDEPVVLLTGDLAFYHDMNGLLAVARCDVDATIVLINNDGGGIFHTLPIEAHDPPFTDLFKTPHGLDFAASATLYELDFERVESREALADAVGDATATDGTTVVEARVDAKASHRFRESLDERVADRLT